MADQIDQAQALEERERAALLAARPRQVRHEGDGWCRTCGYRVEPGRIRALGYVPQDCSFCARGEDREDV